MKVVLSQIITVKLKASLQLNVSIHIRPSIISEEPIYFIDKSFTKQLKLENHFILTDGGMQHIAISLPGLPICHVPMHHYLSQDPISYCSLAKLQCVILAASDSTSVRTYDILTGGCNSLQSYTPYTSAKRAL